jgi:hypothetical protein
MINSKLLPAHILRLYIWELIDQEGGMETINDLIPILPVEDEPKVADSHKAYAIYGYAENESRALEQIRDGIFSIRVVAPTYAQLGQILSTIGRGFESSDVATEAVNRYSTQYPNQALTGIRFLQAKTSYMEGGEAPETEGGPLNGVVNIAYRYVNNLTIPVPAVAAGGLWS